MPTFEEFDVNELLPPNPSVELPSSIEVPKINGEEPMFLTPKEVAHCFGVNIKTVSRWVSTGKLEGKVRIIRTPGNHRRFRTEDIKHLLDAYYA